MEYKYKLETEGYIGTKWTVLQRLFQTVQAALDAIDQHDAAGLLRDNETEALLVSWDLNAEDVPEGMVCPRCGEYRMDFLVWNYDDELECQACGMIYDPEEETT